MKGESGPASSLKAVFSSRDGRRRARFCGTRATPSLIGGDERGHAARLAVSFDAMYNPDRSAAVFWKKFSYPFWFTDLLSIA